DALALRHRSLVPGDTEPLEVGGDRLGSAGDGPRRVGVVDAQQQRATVLFGEAPVRDGAERASEMQRAGRARREAHPDHARTLRARSSKLLVLYRLVLARLTSCGGDPSYPSHVRTGRRTKLNRPILGGSPDA